ncbi:MAG: hypothetical protein LBV40_00835 [Methanomicrobiales archaeon]|nr:hypothetical protein [Methanomicrobiales archaeon]
MVRIPKFILITGMIVIIACVGFVTAAPQACAGCSPDTYPGSSTCPAVCSLAFPADTPWTYPPVANVTPEGEGEEIPAYLISTLSGVVLEIPTLNPLVSSLSGTDLGDEEEEIPAYLISTLSGVVLKIPTLNPFASTLSGTDLSDKIPANNNTLE